MKTLSNLTPSDMVMIDSFYPLVGTRWDGWDFVLSHHLTRKQITFSARRLEVPYLFASDMRSKNFIKYWKREGKRFGTTKV